MYTVLLNCQGYMQPSFCSAFFCPMALGYGLPPCNNNFCSAYCLIHRSARICLLSTLSASQHASCPPITPKAHWAFGVMAVTR